MWFKTSWRTHSCVPRRHSWRRLPVGRLISLCLTFGSILLAQSSLSGPSLGFVFDGKAQGVRPILGIPGSATLGGPLDLGASLATAVVSPQQDYVLSLTTDPFLFLVVRSADGTISTTTYPNISTLPDLIALSPSGKSAALFYRQTATAMVLTGLPASPNVSSTLDLSALPNSIDTLAVTNDGQSLFAGVPDYGQVFLVPADGTSPIPILTVGHASSLALLNKSNDLLVTDDLQNSVSRIATPTGAVVLSQQIAGPFAVLPSADDQKFFVAAQNGTIAVVDANGADPVLLQCTCTPTSLHRLIGGNILQLTSIADGIVWMLDWTDPDNPRFLFVPPGADQQ